MSKELNLLDEFFVISGICTSATSHSFNKRVYLAYDSHSGGYPWWTHCIHQAARFSADKISATFRSESKPTSYMSKEVDKMSILKVSTIGEDISEDTFKDLAREAALAKLTEEDKIALGLK